MLVGIPKETQAGEARVAASPDTVHRLRELGFEVAVCAGAGQGALFDDADYQAAGAHLAPTNQEVWNSSQIILKVQPPGVDPVSGQHEADQIALGGTLIGFIWPARNPALLERLAARRATVLAMDRVPRTTLAQKMDALSSMANLVGYRAVIEAAACYGRLLAGQTTAAGRIPPARVLVIGAGVAGLSAIATARSLGAMVTAFDTRREVLDQIRSMGAEPLTLAMPEEGTGVGGYARAMSAGFLAAEQELFRSVAPETDIIITTAQVPGDRAPTLLPEELVATMRPGSVIVDLAAEQGGNCALTRVGEIHLTHGVTVVGVTDLASRMAPLASQLYGTNLSHLLAEMGGGRNFGIDPNNPIIQMMLLLRGGASCSPPSSVSLPASALTPTSAATILPLHATPETVSPSIRPAIVPRRASPARWVAMGLVGTLMVGIGWWAPPQFLSHLTIFILACFVGWQLVWNVTPALHTPLMSVTNAISGIIVLGGIMQLAQDRGPLMTAIGAAAVLFATVNVVGGFLVTQRMLRMFRR